MDFLEFCKRYQCSVSERRIEVGHRHQRLISIKMYHIYVDVRTMLPFKPKLEADWMHCLSYTDESSAGAKRKAYEALSDCGSLELVAEKQQ